MDAVNTSSISAPRKRRSATKIRASGSGGPGLHYRHVRTTVVLLMHSTVFREFTLREQEAFRELARLNFDLSAAKRIDLEYLFAKLDDELMARVRSEYEFVPSLYSVRNHGACVASCALCGKGDSKDDGSNRDKLQYDFRLQNVAGGDDLWVGRDCIINFGLKVRGAETSEEARAILERNLRECMSMWKKEAWRNAHPDHVAIAEHYAALESFAQAFRFLGRYGSMDQEILLLGQTQREVYMRAASLVKPMRRVLRFYRRSEYLTEKKTEIWQQVKLLLHSLRWMSGVLDRARDLPWYERKDYLVRARAEREARIAAMKSRRTPRLMP